MILEQANTSQIQIEAKSKGAEAYRDPSWWYDIRGFFILTGTYQVMLWNHLNFFSKNLGNRHLEAAIGSGTFLWLTRLNKKIKTDKMHEEIISINYSERILNRKKKLFKNKKDIKLIQADLSKINYPDNYFDSVNIAHSFHAFPDPDSVLKELHRVMKPESKLFVDILLTPRGSKLRKALANRVNKFCFKKGILARTCDLEKTKQQFEVNHFNIVDSYVKGNTYHVIAWKSQSK